MEFSSEVMQKFWAQVEKTDTCWIWRGNHCKSLPILDTYLEDGSRFSCSPRRLSLLLTGRELPRSEVVQPSVCGNKLCVNPSHLVVGDVARFYVKVQKLSEKDGGCWVWIGALDENMYGKFYVKGQYIRAHAYSWELYTGRPAPSGIGTVICHKCDHPYCVNPNHLSLGTYKDNSQDMVSKGRQSKGVARPNAKLNEDQVRNMKAEYIPGKVGYARLGKKYGVSVSVARRIIKGERWAHLVVSTHS